MRDNKWLKMCHEYWFDEWVEYRTCLTMESVDQQIKQFGLRCINIFAVAAIDAVLSILAIKPVFVAHLEPRILV